MALKKLEWKNGEATVGSTSSAKRSIYDHIDLAASNVSLTSTFPVIATGDLDGGGHFTLAGNVGPLNQEDASLTPLDGKVTVNGLNLAARGFLNPSVGLGGLLDLDATIASKNDEREIVGDRKDLEGPSCCRRLTLQTTRDGGFHYKRTTAGKNSGVLGPSTLKIGNATARLSGTYDAGRGEYSLVNIKVAGDHMPVTDLEAFLPGIGIHVPTAPVSRRARSRRT